MGRRTLVARTAAGASALALWCGAPSAAATGTLSEAGHTSIEQRVALAIGPSRTTLWTSVRLEAVAGDIAIVTPAASGAALDYASPAWFEALDVASAPRVFPPDGLDATCPGDPTAFPFHVTTETMSVAPLAPVEVSVLNDAAAVALWASQHGLAMSPAVANGLGTLSPPARFVAVRFSAPAGPALTTTLRVVSPDDSPVLPLVLTEAGTEDLVVTAWVLGAGRAALAGAVEIEVDPDDVTFGAADHDSDYADARESALADAGASGAVVECASHQALAENVAIAEGTATIEGVLTGYIERAAFYGDGLTTTTTCIAAAGAALASVQPVAPSCARADLGVVDGVDTCVETVGPGQTDPNALRCGPGADDLAVALSGQVPLEAWLTRVTTSIQAGQVGASTAVSVGAGEAVAPLLQAGGLDLSGCGEGGGGAGGGPGQGGSPIDLVGGAGAVPGSGNPTYTIPVYEYDGSCDCSGTYVIVDETTTYEETGAYYRDDGDCGGDTETYSDESYEEEEDCGGEPAESAESDDGDCGGDTSDTASDDGSSDDGSSDDGSSDDGSTETYSDSDEGCGSDSTETSDDDGCGGDTSDTSSSDDGCAVTDERPRRRPRPRLSMLLFIAGLVVLPLRRWRRPSVLRPPDRARARTVPVPVPVPVPDLPTSQCEDPA